jgi:hypothetical protein
MRRRTVIVASVAAAAAGLAVCPRDAAAKRKKRLPPPSIHSVRTPLGLQGRSGPGGNVVVIFTAADVAGRPAEVEVQYGLDRNQDGLVTEDEYRRATEDRLDPRNSRADQSPQFFPTGTADGTVNAFVWNSLADIPGSGALTLEYALTPQGRLIPDPDNPRAFLYATGPSGNSVFSGVKLRVRTAPPGRVRHAKRYFGEYQYTDSFALENLLEPSMTIDSAVSGKTVLVGWTAYSRDSEDLNGNGLLDIADGEDINGNNVLDEDRMGVAFDHHHLAPGEDPATMTETQLAALKWFPCTRVPGAGDTDSLDARPGVPVPTTGDLAGVASAPPGVGRRWTFAWDAFDDAGGATDGFILRATPFCQHRIRGATVYSRIVVTPGQ